MFWKKKAGPPSSSGNDGRQAYERAREATRRATFLNVASRMPDGDAVKQEMALLFKVCRTQALKTGSVIGMSSAQVDAEIGSLCDADVARLQSSSNEAFREFADESGRIVKSFLATVDTQDLTEAAGS